LVLDSFSATKAAREFFSIAVMIDLDQSSGFQLQGVPEEDLVVLA